MKSKAQRAAERRDAIETAGLIAVALFACAIPVLILAAAVGANLYGFGG